ncbi:hypothetical protein Y032_0064g3501 [Ancylostoma ceylanicum]|uniref:Myb-like domain-containing protein n=1 Tax=Ancylostoma ceylanicum TaxID=53326 RepID=A0A016U296_9BILA|nr:hypothetical protein Y032_0064g3501 [Ancylostoma ceylanicum]
MATDAVGQLSRTHRISLRLWVFKFIDVEDIESFGVCVEGYRPNDETETVLRNWHSTAISKRITPSLLHSCSGSVYELRGSIDRELARQYGYPPELVELFLNGFPENWKSILKEYFYVVKTTNPMNASHYFSSIARRRSLNTVRGRNLLSGGRESSTSKLRSERLSILPASTTLPVPIAEEIEADDEQKENSMLNSSSLSSKKTPKSNDGISRLGTRRSPRIREILSRSGLKDVKNAETVSSNVSPLPSPAENDESKCLTNDTAANMRQSSANDVPADALEESTASSESSYIFVPRLNSENSQTSEQLPIVQSPASVASPAPEQEVSAGPVFEEPHCSGEISTGEDNGRADDDSSKVLALVPMDSDVFKVPTRRPSRGTLDDAVELSDWSIRFAPIGIDGPELGFPRFVLLGNRKGHSAQWRTSIIIRVESAEILHTSSTKYRLVGDMDIMDSASAGFPKMFVAKFIRGFPPDWRTRITELYDTFFGNLDTHNSIESQKETKQPLLFSQDSEESDRYDQLQKSHYAQNGRTSRAGCSKSSDTIGYNSERGRDARIDSSPSGYSDEPYIRDATSSAAVSRRSSTSGPEVRRSRSGRCIHAPLAQWAGERVRYDGFGNVIGVQGVNTETMHSKGAVGALALSNYYGVSPARPPRQSEAFLQVPELAVDHGPKTMKRRKALVTYSDSSDDGREFNRRRPRPYSDEESPVQKHSRRRAYQTDSEEYEIERELNAERRLLLEQARELRRQQENLIEMERRLAYHEAKWRKKRAKERRFEGEPRSRHYSPVRMVEERNYHRKKPKVEKQHIRKKAPPRQHEEDNYWREDLLDAERLEDDWAREDAQLSDSDYSDGDSDWHEPVRKRRKKRFRRVRKQSSSEDSTTVDDEDEEGSEEEANEESGSKKPALKKEKGWNRTELERLKLALAAIRVRTDDDWEKVARSLGDGRDPESCKQAAIKKLKWEPSAAESPGPVKVSQVVTARAGTIAFQHQTNEYTRKFMLGGGGQGEDFFKSNETNMNNSLAIPDVTEFGADDSLLEALRTPAAVLAERKVANRRQFLAEAEDDDTPIRRRSSLLPMGTPVNSAQRERQDRYFHHLISKGGCRDMSRMNFSRVGNSTRFETTEVGRGSNKGQNYGSLHNDLDYVAKMTRKAARKNAVLEEDSDRDLELEEDVEGDDDDVF